MKPFYLFLQLCFCSVTLFAQDKNLSHKDSVNHYIVQARSVLYDDLNAADPFLEKAAEFANASEETELLAEVDHLYAVANYVKGDYYTSLRYYTSALKLFREENLKLGVAKCLLGRGLIQQGIDRHPEAIRLFRRSIREYEESGHHADASPAFVNIAISEIETGKLDSAEEHLKQAMRLSRQAGRVGIEHLALNRLAEIAFLRGDENAAKASYQQVLEHEEEPNGWEKSYAHAGLAQIFTREANLKAAEHHALLAYDFSKSTGSYWDLERNTRILYEINKAAQNPVVALNYLEENHAYNDSLYDQRKLREINLSQLQNSEAENALLQREKEYAEQRLFLSRSIIGVLVVFAGVLFFLVIIYKKNIRQKSRFSRELEEKNNTISAQNKTIVEHNEALRTLNKTKDRLFSILSHDLRSPVGSIQQILEMIQSGEFSDEEKADLLDEMLLQVSGTSLMLHNLLHWANSQMDGDKVNLGKVDLPSQVEKVLMAHHGAIKAKNIEIEHLVPLELSPTVADKGQLSVVIHNLLSNAIKFTKEGNEILISYEEREKQVLLKILDGGLGISDEKIQEIWNFDTRLNSDIGTKMETGTGLGLLLVKQFLPLNNAELEINSYPGKGAEFIITFIKAD